MVLLMPKLPKVVFRMSVDTRGSHLVGGNSITKAPRSPPGSGNADDEVAQGRIQKTAC